MTSPFSAVPNTTDNTVAFSLLDLAPIVAGSSATESFRNSLDLAQHAERWGYHRFWLAEHHNIPAVASAATAILIAHVAAGTSRIRVGAGGIMLPNHAPLVIAEQFGTLESLHPGRIDLGVGRAPGTDQRTLRALRRDPSNAERFPQDVLELQAFLAPVQQGQAVQAVPGGGAQVPIWILGSSLFGAELAAMLGLPFAFASHFAPNDLLPALELYRTRFEPSAQLDKPYAMAGINIVAADTDVEAKRLFTTAQQGFTNLVRGRPGKMQPPIDDIETYWSPIEKAHASRMLHYAIQGAPATVAAGLRRFLDLTKVDEVMVVGAIYDHQARLRSYEIVAEVGRNL